MALRQLLHRRCKIRERFFRQGSAKKAPTWCDNRLTIHQDQRDTRVLVGFSTEMLRDDVVPAFLTEYATATQRLAAEKSSIRWEREVELANLDRQIGLAIPTILKNVDAAMLVEYMMICTQRRRFLLAEQEAAQTAFIKPELLHPNPGRVYRDKIGQLTSICVASWHRCCRYVLERKRKKASSGVPLEAFQI